MYTLVFLAKPKAKTIIIIIYFTHWISSLRIITHKINYIYRFYILNYRTQTVAVRIRNECEINVKWPVINPGRFDAIKQKMNTTSLIKQKVCLASSLGDSRLSRDLGAPLCTVFVSDNFSKACVYYFSPEHKGMSRNNALSLHSWLQNNRKENDTYQNYL